MANVTLYSIPFCPYCERAKALLKDRGIAYEEVKVDRGNADEVQALRERSGMRTFPQIFNGEKLIGGFTELDAQDKKDKLASLK